MWEGPLGAGGGYQSVDAQLAHDERTIYSPARVSDGTWLSNHIPIIELPFIGRSAFESEGSGSGGAPEDVCSQQPINGSQTRRLVDRDGDFHQSRGRLAIRKKIKRRDWRALYAYDLFHSLVDAPTTRLIFILLLLYVFWVFLFSLAYLTISSCFSVCDLGLDDFKKAFYFSLETQATLGYGTRDIFFGGCVLPAVVLTAHMCVRLVSDALTVGVIYSRLARPTTRASTVLFSNHAVIRRIRGKLYLMFQLCELRKHQLNEAHVRLYSVRKHRDPTSRGQSPQQHLHIQTCSMRLTHPNDETGGMLLLCLPQIVVHEIDACSPLMPPPLWAATSSNGLSQSNTAPEKLGIHRWHPLVVDSSIQSKLNGEFPGVSQRGTHPQSEVSNSVGLKEFLMTQSGNILDAPSGEADRETYAHKEEREMIQAFMRDRNVEVIAVVEGMDAATGGVVQARHSYIVDEIQWHHEHVVCVLEDPESGGAMIDFSRFHDVAPTSMDCAFVSAVSQI